MTEPSLVIGCQLAPTIRMDALTLRYVDDIGPLIGFPELNFSLKEKVHYLQETYNNIIEAVD